MRALFSAPAKTEQGGTGITMKGPEMLMRFEKYLAQVLAISATDGWTCTLLSAYCPLALLS